MFGREQQSESSEIPSISHSRPQLERTGFTKRGFIFAVLSGLAFHLGFSSHPIFAWLFVPLYLFAVEKTQRDQHIAYASIVTGTLGLLLFRKVSSYGVWFYVAIFLFASLNGAAFGWSSFGLKTRWDFPASRMLFPALAWTSLEFLRHILPWTFPGHLAVTQVAFPAFIQIASVTGPYAVSFLIALGSTAGYEFCRWLFEERLRRDKATLVSILLIFILLDLNVLGGLFRMRRGSGEAAGRPIPFALIQGNISIPEYSRSNSDPQFLETLEDRYLDLTMKAASEGAQFIAWPEGILEADEMGRPRVRDRLTDLAGLENAYIVIGSRRTGPKGSGIIQPS